MGDHGAQDHIIVFGVNECFVGFINQLRRRDSRRTPIVILAPARPAKAMIALKSLGPIFSVQVQFCLSHSSWLVSQLLRDMLWPDAVES